MKATVHLKPGTILCDAEGKEFIEGDVEWNEQGWLHVHAGAVLTTAEFMDERPLPLDRCNSIPPHRVLSIAHGIADELRG